MNRKLRMGMIGGGKDAFIGAIHRFAANMDGLIEVSAGALSTNPENAIASGKMLFLPEFHDLLSIAQLFPLVGCQIMSSIGFDFFRGVIIRGCSRGGSSHRCF